MHTDTIFIVRIVRIELESCFLLAPDLEPDNVMTDLVIVQHILWHDPMWHVVVHFLRNVKN